MADEIIQFEELKKYDDPLDDLIDTYGSVKYLIAVSENAMDEPFRHESLEAARELAEKIKSNPLYVNDPEKYKPIKKLLEDLTKER